MQPSSIYVWRDNEIQVICKGIFATVGELQSLIPSLVGVMECDDSGNLVEHAVLLSAPQSELRYGASYLACESQRNTKNSVDEHSHTMKKKTTFILRSTVGQEVIEWFDEAHHMVDRQQFGKVFEDLQHSNKLKDLPYYCNLSDKTKEICSM